jgi:uncharacterized protein (DUF488 family)
MVIYTIGHSTRSWDDFLALLRAHGVDRLADIRTVPRSRRHPHFSADALGRSLPAAAIAYRHFPGLGGLRKPRPDSPNGAWRNESFRGYADHMQTAEFRDALTDLIGWSGAGGEADPRAVIMCAEAVWWSCHRQLTADALLARGWEVCHITSAAPAARHKLTEFARVNAGEVSYPGLV